MPLPACCWSRPLHSRAPLSPRRPRRPRRPRSASMPDSSSFNSRGIACQRPRVTNSGSTRPPVHPGLKYTELPLCRTSLAVNLSAHLLNWQNARYVLKACNASGCGRSLDLGVSHLMQQTLGHFKPAAQLPRRWMGRTMALSEDGGTIAATIETNQSGGVEVFRKSPAGWAYEARLLADPHMEQDLTAPADPAVDISGDGNVGRTRSRPQRFVPGAQPDSSTGAVYMFRRTSAGWVREEKLDVSGFPARRPIWLAGRTRRIRNATGRVAARRDGNVPTLDRWMDPCRVSSGWLRCDRVEW